MEIQYYHDLNPFPLEGGGCLPGVTIAYHTYGTLSPAADNVIWVCHALTANSDVAQWWPHTVEEGKFLDPGRYFVICANILGSHYGTTGPLSVNPLTGSPWYATFPEVTVRDMVRCHKLLADHLGIRRVKLLIGSSIGGFQCLEFGVIYPGFARNIALIATAVQAQPWAIALNESQRMAIELDPTFGDDDPVAGARGMAVARSIALLSYRGQQAYDKTQADEERGKKLSGYRVASYQRYQGEKLCRRFNAYSYHRLTRAIDSHDIARGRGSVAAVLAGIESRCLVVCISSDILFPVSAHQVMRRHIPRHEYVVIDSDFAHDGFLIEHEKLNNIILKFLENE
ncbi:MAG: homoserine O-acetyltransferase [Odoribacteraceae bacterium]|jgi:homoserine O-acetyltransferase|nr:homoserine O-acetyltransferase [Odoribacteraceae bacterium]